MVGEKTISQLLVSSFFNHSTKLEPIPAFLSWTERSGHFLVAPGSRASQMQRNEKAGTSVQSLAKAPWLQWRNQSSFSQEWKWVMRNRECLTEPPGHKSSQVSERARDQGPRGLLSASRVCSLRHPSPIPGFSAVLLWHDGRWPLEKPAGIDLYGKETRKKWVVFPINYLIPFMLWRHSPGSLIGLFSGF